MLIVAGAGALLVLGLGAWWWWVNWIPATTHVSTDWIAAHRYDRKQQRPD